MKCAYNQCNLEVMPRDPERVQRGLEVFHGNCLRKVKQAEQQEALKLNAKLGKNRLHSLPNVEVYH